MTVMGNGGTGGCRHEVSSLGARCPYAGEQVYKLLGRISRSEVISGIPGSAKDNFGVRYTIAEEFVTVGHGEPITRGAERVRSLLGGLE
jgi:hypothetical protein